MLNSFLKPETTGFNVEFYPEDNFLVVAFTGEISLKEIVASISDTLRHQEFTKDMSACYDFSDAVLDIDINTLDVIFHFMSGLREKRGTHYQLALVYSDEITKTLFDFYRLMFARYTVDIEVFTHKNRALEWIKESHKIATVSYIS
jgi:hypothetical protein